MPSIITPPFDEEQNDNDNLNEFEEIQKLLDQYSNFILGKLQINNAWQKKANWFVLFVNYGRCTVGGVP